MLWYLTKKKGDKIMKKRSGFTLAEVLITLGIIGVVAAMTIPTLIANTNSARFRSQFKKTISSLAQAGLMSQAQYDFDYSITTSSDSCSADPKDDDPEATFAFCALFNGTLSGHTIYTTADPPVNKNGDAYNITMGLNNLYYLQLADGSLVAFQKDAHDCTKGVTEEITDVDSSCTGFIDVNGTTLPNKQVTCDSHSDSITVATGNCAVPNDAQHMTDIFPIVFHDGTVEPATPAARYVLTSSK